MAGFFIENTRKCVAAARKETGRWIDGAGEECTSSTRDEKNPRAVSVPPLLSPGTLAVHQGALR